MSHTAPRRTLMAVFAHPDDEAFGSGGSLSRYAAEGVDVHLVTASRGEAGQSAVPGLATQASLPDVREAELRCACLAYGDVRLHLLDYVDGQLTIVHQGQAVGRLVRLIRQVRPDVLITFGPDGIYGHYDHIAVHRWATIAYDLAADPACFPGPEEACEPHQIAKLYYRAMPQAQVAARAASGAGAVLMDGVPFAFAGLRDDEITTFIDVSPYAQRKLEGIRCHRSQIGDTSDYAVHPDRILRDPWFVRESFVLARSTVGQPDGLEDDLFARLPRATGRDHAATDR